MRSKHYLTIFNGTLSLSKHSMNPWTYLSMVIAVLTSQSVNAQYASVGEFQLAQPAIEAENTFFDGETQVSISLDVEGVLIRYALGNEVVSENSEIYEGPLTIRKSETITARAFHHEFVASEQVSVSVFRLRQGEELKVSYDPDPAPQYSGAGTSVLGNLQKGSMNFRDGQWLGFSADTITFNLGEIHATGAITLSVLEDHGSWIFKPGRIEVWSGSQRIGTWESGAQNTFLPKSFQFIEVPLEGDPADMMEIKVLMGKIPDWHDGRGTTPWLFIDELFISN